MINIYPHFYHFQCILIYPVYLNFELSSECQLTSIIYEKKPDVYHIILLLLLSRSSLFSLFLTSLTMMYCGVDFLGFILTAFVKINWIFQWMALSEQETFGQHFFRYFFSAIFLFFHSSGTLLYMGWTI